MIERYTRPEMGNIWTEENRFKAWLEVEILACEAWAELGVIPKEDVKLLRERATFDVNRIKEMEEETGVSRNVVSNKIDELVELGILEMDTTYNKKTYRYKEIYNVFVGKDSF